MKASARFGAAVVAFMLVLSLVAGCGRGRSDAQIADEVRGKLSADASIPSSKQIAVQSSNGVVTLSGTVTSESERGAAAADAAQVQGVKTVVNNLAVAPAAVEAPVPSAAPAATAPARQRSVARPAAPATSVAGITISEGTDILIRMIDSIDSEKNKPGDTFRASLDAPIMVGDRVVISKGADVEGRVVEVESAGRFKGRSELALELTQITAGGRAYQVQTNQWTRQGSSRGKRTAATVGGGAALGAIIGGVAGGGKGAAIGAAAGAGAGTAVQAATKGQQIRVPSETVLEFRLTAPVTLRR